MIHKTKIKGFCFAKYFGIVWTIFLFEEPDSILVESINIIAAAIQSNFRKAVQEIQKILNDNLEVIRQNTEAVVPENNEVVGTQSIKYQILWSVR